MDSKKHCKTFFGLYLEARDDPEITKNVNPRKYDYIYLRPRVNLQGTQKVFFKDTGGF